MNKIKLKWEEIEDGFFKSNLSGLTFSKSDSHLFEGRTVVNIYFTAIKDSIGYESNKLNPFEFVDGEINSLYTKLDALTWHNLIENPNDLPREGVTHPCIIKHPYDNQYPVGYYSRGQWFDMRYTTGITNITAWRYLPAAPPEFKKEGN